MKSKSYSRCIDTERDPQFIDITEWISECVAESGISNGFVVAYSRHTTAAIKINENEPLLLEDVEDFLEKLCPRNADYRHNNFNIRTVNMTENEPANGHVHLQHLVVGTSETIPAMEIEHGGRREERGPPGRAGSKGHGPRPHDEGRRNAVRAVAKPVLH